jgi:hypothetical protein
MPIIKPDTSAAVVLGNIEEGTYPAAIESVEFKSSSKGNPMIVPNFNITVGDNVVKRKAYLVITGEGAYGFEQLLRACNFDTLADAYGDKSIAAADKPDFDTDDLVGQTLNVIIGHQLYNGEMRDYVKSYLKA